MSARSPLGLQRRDGQSAPLASGAVDAWLAIRYLHVVAMAYFLGGQLLLAVAVVPVERRHPDRERLRETARRFGFGSLVALAVLIATGSALASHHHLWGDGKLQLKLGLVALTTVLVALHLRWSSAHILQAAVFAATLAIVWIGLDLSE
jgi:putative copper export protein